MPSCPAVHLAKCPPSFTPLNSRSLLLDSWKFPFQITPGFDRIGVELNESFEFPLKPLPSDGPSPTGFPPKRYAIYCRLLHTFVTRLSFSQACESMAFCSRSISSISSQLSSASLSLLRSPAYQVSSRRVGIAGGLHQHRYDECRDPSWPT